MNAFKMVSPQKHPFGIVLCLASKKWEILTDAAAADDDVGNSTDVFPGFNLAILFPNHKAQNTCLKGGRVK